MDNTSGQTKTEQDWYKFWEEEGLFKADSDSSKPPYGLLIPPPNLTGSLHLGHAMQHAILDALARFKRMQGFDVLLLPGVDHAGIQFEGTLNKLLEKEGTSRQKLGREQWLKRAWQFKEEIYKSFHDIWTVFGISADWSREVFTLDEIRNKAVFEEFKKYYDDGLVYKGAYIVQWCLKCGTAIEDVEMEYEKRKEKLYYVKYEIVGQAGEFITIATARPETIFADTGIAVYPNHPKYAKYIGREARNPLTQGWVKIIEDKRVDKKFGTGALKITPGHDLLDYAIGKDHGLPMMHTIDKTGRMTNVAQIISESGDYSKNLTGLKINEARIKSIEALEKFNALEDIKDYTHSVPVCERCKTTVEPLISEEWFIKMKSLAQKALKNLSKINFIPKNYNKIIADWLKNIHDWCISRDLWWGHQIPVWYCISCNQNYIEITVKDPQKFISNNLPTTRAKIAWFLTRNKLDAILPEIANYTISSQATPVISINNPGKCGKCKSDFIQDPQVLDTWFSSGLWPLSTLEWPASTVKRGEPVLLKKYFPWDFEITAPEIKYLWIARMIMISLYLEDKIPFKNMFFHGMLRDLKGQKFSKSLGNGINPNDLRVQWGTDVVRMALYSYAAPGRDGRASRQTMDERCKNYRNFGTKLKNIARFIVELKPEGIASSQTPRNDVIASEAKQSTPEDKKILDALNKTIKGVTKDLEGFNLHLAIEKLYEFIWHEFADKYIEQSKDRRTEAQSVLEYVFRTSLELLHPFMPFITEELWQKLPHKGRSIMLAKWPKA